MLGKRGVTVTPLGIIP